MQVQLKRFTSLKATDKLLSLSNVSCDHCGIKEKRLDMRMMQSYKDLDLKDRVKPISTR